MHSVGEVQLEVMEYGEQPPQRPFQKLSDIDKITHDYFIGRPRVWQLLKENILLPLPKKPHHNIVWLSGPTGSGKSVAIQGLTLAAETFSNFVVIPLRAATADPLNLLWEAADLLKAKRYPLNKFERKYVAFMGDAPKPKLEIEEKAAEELAKGVIAALVTFLGWIFLKPLEFIIGSLLKIVRAIGKYFLQRSRVVSDFSEGRQLANKKAFLTHLFIQNLNQVAGGRRRGLFWWRKNRRRVFLIFDTFEEWRPDISSWLLDSVLKEIANTQIVVVIPARDELPIAFLPAFERLSPDIILPIALTYFQLEETRVFLRELKITDEADVERIQELTGGSLFYLKLLQFTLRTRGSLDLDQSIDENFLSIFGAQRRDLLLAAALFSRPFAESDLAAIPSISAFDRANDYTWLIHLPFVIRSSGDERYSYIKKAQELFGNPERWPTRRAYYQTRQALADHYRQQLAGARKDQDKGAYADPLELVLAFASQLFFLLDRRNHLTAVEQLTLAYQEDRQTGAAILNTLEKLCLYPPTDSRSVPAYDLIQHLIRFIRADLSGDEREIISTSNELLRQLAATTTNLFRAGRPGIASIYLRRGKIHLAQKTYPAALQDFTDAITLDRQCAQAYTGRGEASYQEYVSQLAPYQSGITPGELQSALEDLTKACKLDPHFARAYLFRGRIYYRYGIYPQAIKDFTDALEYDRDSPELLHERGLAYRNLGTPEGYQKAVADFNRAIMLKRDFAEAHADRGIVYREQKAFSNALPEFDRALTLNPELAWARAHRGRTYRRLFEYQRALEDLDWAIGQRFRPSWVYLHRGIAYLGLGRLDLAIQDFEESSRLKSTDTNARWMEEWAKMCRGARDAGIIDRLRLITQIDPEQYAALVCAGVALWFEGAFDQALVELDAALKLDADEWDAPFWKGMSWVCLDKSVEALKMLEQALGSGLPPLLLRPLHWLQEKNAVFYARHAKFLLDKHGINAQN